MVLSKEHRETLNNINGPLQNIPIVVNDLLPRLNHVLLQSDITRVKFRFNTDGGEWAVNDLLMYYQTRATSLDPMVEALRACGLDEIVNMLTPNATAAAAAPPAQIPNQLTGQKAVKVFQSREVARLFNTTVKPLTLLPHLSGWLLSPEDVYEVKRETEKSGDDAGAMQLHACLVSKFLDRDDFTLQELTEILDNQSNKLVEAIRKAIG